MTSFEQLLRSLAEARVDFIVVGGIAGGLHGAARTTYDLDVVYARDAQNLARLVGARPRKARPTTPPPCSIST